jgi:hypothetical protein
VAPEAKREAIALPLFCCAAVPAARALHGPQPHHALLASPLPRCPQNSDLTEATLTGAWLSIAAAVVMFFLLVAVRPFLFHV